MAVLNDWNEKTKKNMHLMITKKCNRKCPYCCNNFYRIEDIQIARTEEFSQVENVFLTGGEPFVYTEPTLAPHFVAKTLKANFPNLKKVYVYSNVVEFFDAVEKDGWKLENIDGINFSIKNKKDYDVYVKNRSYLEKKLQELGVVENRIYCFPGFEDIKYSKKLFTKFNRIWQTDFQAAADSFFRRMEGVI